MQSTRTNTLPRKGQFVSQDNAAALFRLYMAAAWENTCNPCPVLQRIMQRYESLLSSVKVSAPKAV